MKRRLFRALVVAAVLAVPVSVWAYSYIGFEQITVAGTAIGFTITKICPDSSSSTVCNSISRQATIAVCTLETAEIRYTIDGTTPTSTVGMLWTSTGTTVTFNGPDVLKNFRAIRTGSSGQLDCTFVSP